MLRRRRRKAGGVKIRGELSDPPPLEATSPRLLARLIPNLETSSGSSLGLECPQMSSGSCTSKA